jgi:hypothetical protein
MQNTIGKVLSLNSCLSNHSLRGKNINWTRLYGIYSPAEPVPGPLQYCRFQSRCSTAEAARPSPAHRAALRAAAASHPVTSGRPARRIFLAGAATADPGCRELTDRYSRVAKVAVPQTRACAHQPEPIRAVACLPAVTSYGDHAQGQASVETSRHMQMPLSAFR